MWKDHLNPENLGDLGSSFSESFENKNKNSLFLGWIKQQALMYSTGFEYPVLYIRSYLFIHLEMNILFSKLFTEKLQIA